MITTPFTDGWTFLRSPEAAPVTVRLPHDAMIGETRSADGSTAEHGGYFPGGVYRYAKTWRLPADAADHDYRLLFEGVYGDTTVLVNGEVAATCVSGYREFSAPIGGVSPGSDVDIEVTVDNSRTPNSRWYTGSGIYRPVWLERRPRTHIADDGITLVTRAISEGTAHVDVDVRAANQTDELTAVVKLVADDGGEVTCSAPVIDGVARVELVVPRARLWSAATPHLYGARVQLCRSDEVVDEESQRVGLRIVEVDATHGLRVNGEQVLLRGACVHHDSGVLGAATFAAAERRRVRILQTAGYNAIRSSHQPMSRALLDACDELGMYVMDELTDVWLQHKTPHDTAEVFEEVWPADARSMVAKDRNRPSVILYSLGNEIAESGTAEGIDATRRIAAAVSDLDPTRPTTLAVNLLLNLMAAKGRSAFDRDKPADGAVEATEAKKKDHATSTAANMVTAKLGRIMEWVSRLPAADKASRDAFAEVDVAGYNYAFGRYRGDRKRYPQRVMVGSESMPGDLPRIWRQVESVPGVIGDFMWTGWDYLGEAGIGVWAYGQEPGGLAKPYPALLAGPGAFDITGQPGAPVFLCQAVWGLLDAPAIAVRPMDKAGQRPGRTPWRTTDAVPSWSWGGLSGEAQIEVYSADDEVELLLNGRSLGRKRSGARTGYVTRFSTAYEPGELVAVGYRAGVETGRSTLCSAGEPRLTIRTESPDPDGADDVRFVWVELADEDGVVDCAADDLIDVHVDGPADLVGLGSADPAPRESYTDASHHTWRGRALAVLRPTGEPGTVTLTASSRRHGEASAKVSLDDLAPSRA